MSKIKLGNLNFIKKFWIRLSDFVILIPKNILLFVRKRRKIILALFFLVLILSILPFLLGTPARRFKNPQDVALSFELKGTFVNVNSYETYYESYGEKTNPAILFLHGFGGSSNSFRKNLEAIASNGFFTIAVDLKGFGLSSKIQSEDYSFDAQVEFLRNFLQIQGIENISIVGHSMGGAIAFKFAQIYPNLVEKLILVAPAIFDSKNNIASNLLSNIIIREYFKKFVGNFLTKERITEYYKNFSNRGVVFEQEDIDRIFLPLEIEGWEDTLAKFIIDSSQNSFERCSNTLFCPASYTLDNGICKSEDLYNSDSISPDILEVLEYCNIVNPTLIVWGGLDTVLPVQNGLNLHTKIPNSFLKIIEDGSHFLLDENFDLVNKIIEKFLKNSSL